MTIERLLNKIGVISNLCSLLFGMCLNWPLETNCFGVTKPGASLKKKKRSASVFFVIQTRENETPNLLSRL